MAIALLLLRRGSGVVTTAFVLVGLLSTPAVWSAVTVAHPNSINPVAGGVSEMSGGGFGGGGMPGSGRVAAGSGASPGGGAAPGGSAQGGSAQGGFGSGSRPGGSSARDGAGRAAGDGGASRGGGTGAGFGAGASTADNAMIAWLEQNAAGSTYLAATFGAQSAASLIVASDGGSFLPIGGFNGTDAVPTLDAFIALVKAGDVRYVIEGQERGGGGLGASSTSSSTSTTSAQIRDWVGQNCAIDTGAPSTVYACG